MNTNSQYQKVADLIRTLLAGQSPNAIDPCECGPWAEIVSELYHAHDIGGTAAVRRVFTALVKHTPDLIELVASDGELDPNPLETRPSGRLQLGWIDEYSALMTALTGAPEEFNRLSALVAVATALQQRACLRMAFADIYPNLYGAIIAPSTVFHKSASLNRVRTLLQRAHLDYLVLTELMTSEGLLKELQSRPAGVILRDEIGTLFGSNKVKYLRLLKQDLTALYDGNPYRRQLSNETIRVESPYLNILGATTPAQFYETITFTDWHDGFLARWLWVMPEGDPDFAFAGALLTPEHDSALSRLASRLQDIDRQPVTDFQIDAKAHARWQTWHRETLQRAYQYGDEVISAIVGRYSTYALKFALLLAAINGPWGRITDETMGTAMALADSYKRNVKRLLEAKQDFGINGSKLQKVLRVISDRGLDQGATTKEILQYTKMKASEVRLVLEKLVEIGAVIPEKAGNGWRYTATTATLPIKSW